jgi:hypothetical protein
MTFRRFLTVSIAFSTAFFAGAAAAHVPYLEKSDFSADNPFEVKNIPQSKAMYSWLEAPSDVDHFVMQVDEPTRIFVNTIVPHCQEYVDFTLTYAVIGPGLPVPDDSVSLPVELPADHGVVVIREEIDPNGQRPILYEGFTNRVYFEGPTYDVQVESPGQYAVIVWQEDGQTGDYVAVIGKEEQFGPADIWTAWALHGDSGRNRHHGSGTVSLSPRKAPDRSSGAFFHGTCPLME